jgi:broad specificity phosphatase PhoE
MTSHQVTNLPTSKRLYLVRHGKAKTTWDDHEPDPGLNAVGQAQAEAKAAELANKGPLPLVTSPLRRTRETAKAFEAKWNVTAQVDTRIGEIPSPPGASRQRAEWLREVLQRRWRDLEEPLREWRQQVLEALVAIGQDTVVVSHYVAINVAVGWALGDDRVTCFRPENCSCTLLELQGDKLEVVELGAEGEGRIL